MSSSSSEIAAKLKILRSENPELGKKKLLAQLNSDNGWKLMSKEFRQHMSAIEAEEEEEGEKAKKEEGRERVKKEEEREKGREEEARQKNDTGFNEKIANEGARVPKSTDTRRPK